MKDYSFKNQILAGLKGIYLDLLREKRFQIGSLIDIRIAEDMLFISLLDLVTLKITDESRRWYWNRPRVARLGSYAFDVWFRMRPHRCPSCGSYVRADELRQHLEAMGIFGEVMNTTCVYCAVPKE